MKKVPACTLVTLALVLLLSGCTGTVRESASPGQSTAPSERPSGSEPPADTVYITASFRREDGTPLVHGTIRISDGDNSIEYPLDSSGALRLSGLSRSGALSLTILDQQGQEAVSIPLRFTTGVVIDATTNTDGCAHIVLKEDTDEVALEFTWNDDGSLLCSLHISQTGLSDGSIEVLSWK